MKYGSSDNLDVFIKQLSSLAATCGTEQFPNVTIFWGNSEYLILKGVETYQSLIRNRYNCSVTSYEGKDLNPNNLNSAIEQQDMFSPQQCLILKRCEQIRSFQSILDSMPTPQDGTFVCINLVATSLNEKMKSALKKLNATQILCHEPHLREVPNFVARLATKKRLKLSEEAVQVITHAYGTDLFNIDNFICILEMIFGATGSPIGANQVNEHLGSCNTELIFKIESYLATNKKYLAIGLISDLLDDSEPALTILAILTNFIRKCLRFEQGLQGGTPLPTLAKQLRVPTAAAHQISRYLDRQSRTYFIRLLQKCQMTDSTLKSNSINPKVVLTDLILEF